MKMINYELHNLNTNFIRTIKAENSGDIITMLKYVFDIEFMKISDSEKENTFLITYKVKECNEDS